MQVNLPPRYFSSLKSKWISILKDLLQEYIVSEIRQIYANSYYDDYLLNDEAGQNFIIDQMIYNNHEVNIDGNEMFVSNNNRDLIDEDEIKDYVESNTELKKYLKKILIKFYYKSIDINQISRIIWKEIESKYKEEFKDAKYFDDYLDQEDINNIINAEITNNPEPYAADYVIEDNLDQLDDFLRTELKKVDVINEITINPPTVFKPGETIEYFGEKLTLGKNTKLPFRKIENEEEYYLIDDEKTGQKFYTSKDNIKKLKKDETN